MVNPSALQARRIDVPDSFEAVQDYCWKQGWTDGMPVVPPTEEAVRRMLSGYGGDPASSLGIIQPRNAKVTLEKVAINAVMAGCVPEYFPVVVAAVRAVLQEEFNVAGVSATTGGGAPVIIVNGPIAKQLEINSDVGCFGPGWRANATIGRALRLVIRNMGGLIPGEMDKATLSTPGRYSFCFAENEDRSPWEPRHVELGFEPSDSTLTIIGIRGVYTVMETTVPTGYGVLQTIIATMKAGGVSNYYQIGTGAQIVVVLCPEHAQDIATSGLSKPDVRQFIYQNARMPIRQLRDMAHWGNRNWPAWIDQDDPETLVPIVRSMDDIVIVTAGGDGRHSAWLAGWGVTRVVTRQIELPT
ncbi:MAG: hypothetical protein BZY75_03700 [SAR202 cluster bacterium Io17-Chloro-G7]|nr:MAG: hypothetical protein BZY75_03700 [SAR202 cluster bacterium Io17-Chloro-G7]